MASVMTPSMIITMAGQGRRFRDAGYRNPKYMINARGRSLFAWSMLSLTSFIKAGAPFVFVVQKSDEAGDFIHSQARELGIERTSVIEIEGLTDGQATSVLYARPALASEEEAILIFNIDTHVRPEALAIEQVRGAGWAPCFIAEGDKWSFARIGADGRVSEMREKQRISANATLGLYYFASMALFESAYAKVRPEAGERYVAPLYNELIARDLAVFADLVAPEDVIALGTPDDLLAFDPTACPESGP